MTRRIQPVDWFFLLCVSTMFVLVTVSMFHVSRLLNH